MENKNIIVRVEKGSIAEEMGVEPGDTLISINGKVVKDVFDYRFLLCDSFIEILIEKENKEEWILEIEKEEYESLGIDFENSIMDNLKSCKNKCVFCFIDQLPKNLRDSLYFKDDDSRLSFLNGNYVTLTNMTDDDIDRIILYKLSPVNISVHTTNKDLRIKMLNNKNASKIMEHLKKLSDSGIEINAQIVTVKGLNDKSELESTINDLSEFTGIKSISVVPAGLTKYRDGLYPLTPFSKKECSDIINQVHKLQKIIKLKRGINLVHAADELYVKSDTGVPPYESYEGFLQLENGVGMLRLFQHEVEQRLKSISGDFLERRVSIVTGAAAFSFMNSLCKKFEEKFPNLEINVFEVKNEFFGELITVSGLITGQDIISTLKNQNIGKRIIIPENCLRQDEDVFLDDLTITDIEKQLNTICDIVAVSGEKFVDIVLKI